MKKFIEFLKEHYPILLLVILPPIFLLSTMNEYFSSIVMNFILVLTIIMGIALLIGLLLLINYIISLYIKWGTNNDLDSLVLAIKWTIGLLLFIIYIVFGEEIDNFLF